jgi:hypothetical protein
LSGIYLSIGLITGCLLAAPPEWLSPDRDGFITARAQDCAIQTRDKPVVRKDNRDGKVVLSNWTRATDVPTWTVRVPRDGRYIVEAVYSAGPESAGVVYTVVMRGSTVGMVKGIVESTGGDGRRVRVSDMELDAGDYILSVQPENRKGQPAMTLEAVILHRTGK